MGLSVGVELWADYVEGPGHQVLLPTSVPGGSSCARVGGEEGALCVPGAGKQPELLAGNSGPRGQGPAGSHQPAGVGPLGNPGDMTLERLGESEASHISVPCGQPWSLGVC